MDSGRWRGKAAGRPPTRRNERVPLITSSSISQLPRKKRTHPKYVRTEKRQKCHAKRGGTAALEVAVTGREPFRKGSWFCLVLFPTLGETRDSCTVAELI